MVGGEDTVQLCHMTRALPPTITNPSFFKSIGRLRGVATGNTGTENNAKVLSISAPMFRILEVQWFRVLCRRYFR